VWMGTKSCPRAALYYTASVSRLPLSVGGSTLFLDDTIHEPGHDI